MPNRSTLGAVCVVCLLAVAAIAAEPGGGSPTPDSTLGVVSVDPSGSISAARDAFIEVDVPTASAQVRKAAHALRDAASSATEATRDSMHQSAMELDSLGRRIENRSVESVVELDRVFARAFHALARHDHETGQRHWRDRNPKQAGHRLRAAADNLERAAAASGQRLNAAGNEVVRESRVVSGQLIRGTGYMADEVGMAFEGLGKQVESLGDRIAARRPTPIIIPK